VAAKGQYTLTKRNRLYGKIGAQFYEYEISQQGSKIVAEDGIGLFIETGWQYRWDNGIGMNVGLQSIDMGDLDVAGETVGKQYHF
jgi:hypothetical protein